MRKILLAILVLSNVYGQNTDNKSLDDLSLEELMDIKIYSATKSYQRIEEIPANITVITRKELDKYNYTSLDELLKSVPGLFILDDTEHYQIGTRGSLGSSFKLMINNNPISPLRVPVGGTSNRNFFATPVESIDRIEIIKGPQAVTYGSNSMYGSINIITNDFNEKNIVKIGKGNNGQNKAFARLNHAHENGGFTLNTSFYNTDGLKGNLEDAFKESYLNSRNTQALKKVDGTLEQKYKTVDLSHRYKNLTTDITYSQTNYGLYIEPSFEDGNQVEQTEKAIAFTYEDDIGENIIYKINYIKSQKNYDIDDLNIVTPTYNGNNYAKIKRDQIDAHLNYTLNDKVKLFIGSSYERIDEKFTGLYDTRKLKRDYTLTTKDIYGKVQYKYNDSFAFNAGLRYTTRNKFKLNEFRDTDLSTPEYNIDTSSEYKTDKSTLPEISTIYHIDSHNHLKLLYGKANQLKYQSADVFEEIETTELNYYYISRKYHINSSLFYNKAKNISLFVQNNDGAAKTTNGELDSKGIEFSITYKPNYSFQTSSSFVYQKSKSSTNLEPAFSPEFLAKLAMTYTNKKTKYTISSDYISSMRSAVNTNTNTQYDIDSGERYGVDTPVNITLNANINHKLKKDISINLHGTNLTNRDNRIPAGSTINSFYKGGFTKGRTIMLSIDYKF
jgi:outer membrane receptor protein involved in Fe transport